MCERRCAAPKKMIRNQPDKEKMYTIIRLLYRFIIILLIHYYKIIIIPIIIYPFFKPFFIPVYKLLSYFPTFLLHNSMLCTSFRYLPRWVRSMYPSWMKRSSVLAAEWMLA